jgi:hypothetical protein
MIDNGRRPGFEFTDELLLETPTVTVRDVFCRGSCPDHSEEEYSTVTPDSYCEPLAAVLMVLTSP